MHLLVVFKLIDQSAATRKSGSIVWYIGLQ